jgi:alkanesulfonate monooxygenase SsuD/methylene tetrahydromethanopterin reductase-like flavin-dependent oxidoreductase (luciferase family)
MRIAIGVGGEVIGAPMTPQDIVDEVTTAEADGFGAAWSVHFSRGVDALDILAVAGTRTSRIDLGVGIVPTYPRHPLALAQQAATTQALCGGRLTLGVGVSHRPVQKHLARLAGAGVTELWPIIFPVGDDPGASRRRTRELLAGLAAADPG